MVNGEGDILIHPDFNLVKNGANVGNFSLFTQMQENGDTNRQLLVTDDAGKKYFGSYRRLSFGELSVLTTADAAVLLQPVAETTKRNIYLTVIVLFLSIMFIWFFSKSISRPVKTLARAAERIEQGEFELDLKPKTRDELGLLTSSFVKMGKGLAERERLKDSFGRFINKEIAELAMRGELALGGETKEATIFFSDIRSFTAISEKLTPAEVVEFLNEYMTSMVKCVNATHGVVDKFIGDAVMSVWGAPTSAGSPKEDALNCIRAALRMRAALIIFNRGRGGDKKPVIRIGCGINSGPVVAGQIGSMQRWSTRSSETPSISLPARKRSISRWVRTSLSPNIPMLLYMTACSLKRCRRLPSKAKKSRFACSPLSICLPKTASPAQVRKGRSRLHRSGGCSVFRLPILQR